MPDRPSFLAYSSLAARDARARFDGRLARLGGEVNANGEFVLYWMQAHRRLERNLALDYAAEEAWAAGLPLVVYESLRPDYRAANDRIHRFVLDGVAANRADAARLGIRYHFFLPRTPEEARGALRRLASRARVVVTDDFPTFVVHEQARRFAARSEVATIAVDQNGLLPMGAVGRELETAFAYRHFLHRNLRDSWTPPSATAPDAAPFAGAIDLPEWDGSDVEAAVASCAIDHSVAPVALRGGRHAALEQLRRFLDVGLQGYGEARNRDPLHSSGLSPYLHFGFLGIYEIVEAVLRSGAAAEDVDGFLEQLVVRRELAFNFCHHRADHESLSAIPAWAMRTLDRHRADVRPHLYDDAAIEFAATHDEVWNLAQRALLRTGTIQGYLRMVWGKKMIEWSATPEEAHRRMVWLHDKYAIDGRDPNTHAGILWCFGKHDRPFADRPITGQLRPMSSDATKKKVDLALYARIVDATQG